jgi:hypothetical protein
VTFLLSVCAVLMLVVGVFRWTREGAVVALPFLIWGAVAFALILWTHRPRS